MPDEVLHWLNPQPGGFFLDGTLGGGGHTRLIAQRVGPDGRVLSVDRDPTAVAAAETNLKGLPIVVSVSNYADLPEVVEAADFPPADGVVLDLGFSSDQLEDDERGFSFDSDGELDMRFDPTRGEPAWKLLQRWTPEHIADALYEFGEEKASRKIARAVVARRHRQPIRTAREFAELVRKCVRPSKDRLDPATRSFQALRIAVNDELKWLEVALRRLPDLLKPGGRIVMISFHSLEDRRVKEAFRADKRLEILTPKPIGPTDAERQRNSRARSAKLRVAARREAGID
jgi:16S rRNA (cytosine1402-N4)-methyltransferase